MKFSPPPNRRTLLKPSPVSRRSALFAAAAWEILHAHVQKGLSGGLGEVGNSDGLPEDAQLDDLGFGEPGAAADLLEDPDHLG